MIVECAVATVDALTNNGSRRNSPRTPHRIWDAWHDKKSDGWIRSFAIITTSPNELTATVHNRMPVILHPHDYDEWLLHDDQPPPLHLLQPFPAPRCRRGLSLATSATSGTITPNC